MEIQPVDDLDPRIAQELGLVGNTPAWTCIADNRFCYFLYIPRDYFNIDRLQLAVLIHGSFRDPYKLRERFTPFAEQHACALLAPLFPAGLSDPQDTGNYKQLKYNGIRYDRIALAMVDEVRARFRRVETDRFFLYGFSGGGQFVHRFAYLYPQRLKGVACGAPGSQTFPDKTRIYPEGVKDLEQVFGVPLRWDQLCLVPSIFIVGEADTDTFYAIARGRSVESDDKLGRYGATVRLEASWRAAGANCRLHVVPGAGHSGGKMLEPAISFFEQVLTNSTGV